MAVTQAWARFPLALIAPARSAEGWAEDGSQEGSQDGLKHITVLFTNHLESAYDPVPAYWDKDIARIGGIAGMTTLTETIRRG